MGHQGAGNPDGVQAIIKGFHLLETVVEHGGRSTVTELMEASGLPLGTVHRLVRTLVEIGYLRQDSSRGYTLGSRVLFLADMAPSILNRVALPDLARIAGTSGETVFLSRMDQDDAVCIAQAPGRNTLRHFVEVGTRVPAYASASGKAILAYRDPEAVRASLTRQSMVAFTHSTLTDVDALMSELADVRARGYALNRREFDASIASIAIPVPQTTVRTAIEVSGPADRITEEFIAQVIPDLQTLAVQLEVEFCRPAPSAKSTTAEVTLADVS